MACIVLYHGGRPWNAPKNLHDLFEDAAPDTYHLVERRRPDAPPPSVLDLPQVVLGLAGTSAFRRMRAELPVLLRLVKACRDEDFERYMARTVRAMLRSRGRVRFAFAAHYVSIVVYILTSVVYTPAGWQSVDDLPCRTPPSLP